jgi:serine/threonine protein kinase
MSPGTRSAVLGISIFACTALVVFIGAFVYKKRLSRKTERGGRLLENGDDEARARRGSDVELAWGGASNRPDGIEGKSRPGASKSDSADYNPPHSVAAALIGRGGKGKKNAALKGYAPPARPGFHVEWFIAQSEMNLSCASIRHVYDEGTEKSDRSCPVAIHRAKMVDQRMNSKPVSLLRIPTTISEEELATFAVKMRGLQNWSYPMGHRKAKLHPHVAKVDGLFQIPVGAGSDSVPKTSDKGELPRTLATYVVTECIDQDSVETRLAAMAEQTCTNAGDDLNLIQWAWQIAAALYYLHGKETTHGDIRASNMVLFRSRKNGEEVKLTGFAPDTAVTPSVKGYSKKLSLQNSVRRACERAAKTVSSPAGVEALTHLSPERAMNGGSATKASDMWAYGVFLVRLFSCDKPYGGDMTPSKLLEGIATQKIHPRTVEVESVLPHADLAKLINGCLTADPEGRWTAQRAVAMLNNVVVEARQNKKMLDGHANAFSTGGGAARGQNLNTFAR